MDWQAALAQALEPRRIVARAVAEIFDRMGVDEGAPAGFEPGEVTAALILGALDDAGYRVAPKEPAKAPEAVRRYGGAEEDPALCAVEVGGPGGFRQCRNKRGHGKGGELCKRHAAAGYRAPEAGS